MVTRLEVNWAPGGFVVTACGEQFDECTWTEHNGRDVSVSDGRSSSQSNRSKLRLCVS